MKSYRYAELCITCDQGVSLCSTDSQVLDWVLAELKKVITGFQGRIEDKLPSGEGYELRIDKLRNKDFRVGWWILKQLLLQGWGTFCSSF